MSQNLEATTEIKSSADKFYGFFRNTLSDLVNIFPANFKSVQILEGEEGSVGCVELWNYVIVGISMTAKVKYEAINDGEKSITYTVLDGDVMQLYKSFKATITVSDGSAKWFIEYEKALEIVPIPEAYAALAIETCKVVDLYLLTSNN
ncbi:Polyketide cyclase/dehydrase and lipid transport superfamily protein [Abeliophyllum distichum]|uniref:Polyketide cyclase/dehydrase and lipid transport superfamily protein n=1 Tax=Abeliophyllum distichum TaxID=126358 RepID=A0ABD1SFP8_9LAMI